MAEYAGYVATPPVNYGAITDGLVSNIIAIDQAKREEDKKTQLEFDKNFDENTKQLKEFEFSKSQSFNDLISNLGNGIKKTMYNAYQTGSKQAVNRVSANLKTGINNINAASKAISENFAIIEKATIEGQVSPMGNVYADMYVDAVDFKNGAFAPMDDGTIPYIKYDKNGKIESQNNIFNVGTLAKAAPFLDKNVDYEKDLNSWAQGLGTFKDEQGRVVTVNPSLNPAFPKAKETKIEALTSTPRNAARFLSSIAGYQGYKNEETRKKLISDGVPEDKLIKVSLINGVPEPVLSDEQQAAAKEIAAQQIDQRIGIQTTLEKASSGGGGFSGLNAFLFREAYREGKEARREAKLMAPKVKTVQIVDKMFSGNLTKGSGSKYYSEWGPLRLRAANKKWKNVTMSQDPNGAIVISGLPGIKGQNEPRELIRLNNPSEAYAFMTGQENIVEAQGDYEYAKDFMLSNQPAPTPAPAKPAPAKPKGPKEEIYIDIKGTIDLAKKAGKTVTPQQIKAAAMKKNPDKKIIWTNEK
jgi:hypothetical protein